MMATAHVAPGDGPLRVLLTTEFLTAPLFAMLVGCGAQLSANREAPCRTTTTVIRGAALVGLGLLLDLSSAQVVIVLVHLGLLTWLCLPLSRARTPLLVAAGVLVGILALLLPMATVALGPMSAVTPVLGAAGGTGPYRLAAMLLYAVVGMLMMRALPVRGGESSRGPASRRSGRWRHC